MSGTEFEKPRTHSSELHNKSYNVGIDCQAHYYQVDLITGVHV